MNRSVLRGLALIVVAVAVIVGILLMSGPKGHKVNPPSGEWILVSTNPDTQYGTYLGNGYLSTRIMGDGVGSQDGKPLPCYIEGLYVDEKLCPAPTWSDLRFYDGQTEFKLDKKAPYAQWLNMKEGILTTQGTWRAGGKSFGGKIEVMVCRFTNVNFGIIRTTISPDFSGSIRVVNPIGLPQALPPGVAAQVSLPGISYINGKNTPPPTVFFQSQFIGPGTQMAGDHMAVACEINLLKGHDLVTSLFSQMGLKPILPGSIEPLTLESMIADHKASMARLWEKDIIIDGSERDQKVVRSCMFYLLQSAGKDGQFSIPPMGLSNTSFNGHVFWDADTWMFPALLLQHPELAKTIVDYRFNTLSGAKQNAKASGLAGAEYAWESGATGVEDAPANIAMRQERHINGDVALAQWQYYLATGNKLWLTERGFPVLSATADYWVSRAKLDPSKGKYVIAGVVPPDETAEIVNNSVYTNAIAKMNLEFAAEAAKIAGKPAKPEWAKVAAAMYLPDNKAENRFLMYDGYTGQRAKQADAELLLFPLQFDADQVKLKNTFEYCSQRVMANGPAMTSSVHSVIYGRFGDSEKAYQSFTDSFEKYLRGEFNYFNEKRTESYKNACFLTGAAGPITATIYGLAGLRYEYMPKSYDLVPAFTVKPCLPKEWKSVTIKGIQWRGKTYDLVAEQGKAGRLVAR